MSSTSVEFGVYHAEARKLKEEIKKLVAEVIEVDLPGEPWTKANDQALIRAMAELGDDREDLRPKVIVVAATKTIDRRWSWLFEPGTTKKTADNAQLEAFCGPKFFRIVLLPGNSQSGDGQNGLPTELKIREGKLLMLSEENDPQAGVKTRAVKFQEEREKESNVPGTQPKPSASLNQPSAPPAPPSAPPKCPRSARR